MRSRRYACRHGESKHEQDDQNPKKETAASRCTRRRRLCGQSSSRLGSARWPPRPTAAGKRTRAPAPRGRRAPPASPSPSASPRSTACGRGACRALAPRRAPVAAAAAPGSGCPGRTGSPAGGPCWRQGSQFRRNFGEIPEKIPFPLVTGKRNFATFR